MDVIFHQKSVMKNQGFAVADLSEFFSEEEARQILRKVINYFEIGGSFVATKGETCDCIAEIRLPKYCETVNGQDSVLLKINFAEILADRSAAIAEGKGAV